MSTSSLVSELIEGAAEYVSSEELGLVSTAGDQPPSGTIPTSLSQLNIQLSRTYDLSATAASQLSIPIIGSVSGGFDRRVIVLERTAFKEIPHTGIKYQYGYAIRLAITVNKITAHTKLTLPFLAASAQIGRVEGKWILQVVGLAGREIDGAILPPTDLSVETFVLAKQSLGSLIDAVNETSTTFSAVQVGVIKPSDLIDKELRIAIGRAYALGRIEKGRSVNQAVDDLDVAEDVTKDTIKDTYKDFAGIMDPDAKPSESVRTKAKATLGEVKTGPR